MKLFLRSLLLAFVWAFLSAGLLEKPQFGDPRQYQSLSKQTFLSDPSIRGRARGIIMQAEIGSFLIDGRQINIAELRILRDLGGEILVCRRANGDCYQVDYPFFGSENVAYWVGMGQTLAFTLLSDSLQIQAHMEVLLEDEMEPLKPSFRGQEFTGTTLDERFLVNLWRHIDYGVGFAGTSKDDEGCSVNEDDNLKRVGFDSSGAEIYMRKNGMAAEDSTWVNHDMDVEYTARLLSGRVEISGMPERMSWFSIPGIEPAIVEYECPALSPWKSDSFILQRQAIATFRLAAIFRSFATAHPEEYGEFVRISVEQLRARSLE